MRRRLRIVPGCGALAHLTAAPDRRHRSIRCLHRICRCLFGGAGDARLLSFRSQHSGGFRTGAHGLLAHIGRIGIRGSVGAETVSRVCIASLRGPCDAGLQLLYSPARRDGGCRRICPGPVGHRGLGLRAKSGCTIRAIRFKFYDKFLLRRDRTVKPARHSRTTDLPGAESHAITIFRRPERRRRTPVCPWTCPDDWAGGRGH